MDNGVSDIMR